jgi:hypothetical protein
MNETRSLAARKVWSKIPKEKRSLRMAMVARAKWNKMSEEDRKLQIQRMVKGRNL